MFPSLNINHFFLTSLIFIELTIYSVFMQVREYMAKLGFRKVSDMIGRCDMLMPDAKQLNHKSKVSSVQQNTTADNFHQIVYNFPNIFRNACFCIEQKE